MIEFNVTCREILSIISVIIDDFAQPVMLQGPHTDNTLNIKPRGNIRGELASACERMCSDSMIDAIFDATSETFSSMATINPAVGSPDTTDNTPNIELWGNIRGELASACERMCSDSMIDAIFDATSETFSSMATINPAVGSPDTTEDRCLIQYSSPCAWQCNQVVKRASLPGQCMDGKPRWLLTKYRGNHSLSAKTERYLKIQNTNNPLSIETGSKQIKKGI